MTQRLSGEPVRDLVPAQKNQEGIVCQVQVLDETGFARALRSRLPEELRAYINRPTLDGLAEIAELVESLAQVGHGDDGRTLDEARRQLRERSGSYEGRQVMTALPQPPQAPALDYEAEEAVVVPERPGLEG